MWILLSKEVIHGKRLTLLTIMNLELYNRPLSVYNIEIRFRLEEKI